MQRFITTIAAALLAGLFSLSAPAQSPDEQVDREADRRAELHEQFEQFGEVRDRLTELAGEFNLTGEQREAIRAIAEAGASVAREIGSEMLANRDALTTAITGEPADSAAIDAIAAEQAGLATQLVMNRANTLRQIREVLTEDQLGMIAEIRAAFQAQASAFVAGDHPIRERLLALRVFGGASADSLNDLAREFGLSPAQRATVRAILEQAVPETLGTLKDMAVNRRDLIAAVAAEPFDVAEVEAIAVEQGALFGQLVAHHADTLIQVRGVLTDEQLGFIAELRALVQERLARVADSIHL